MNEEKNNEKKLEEIGGRFFKEPSSVSNEELEWYLMKKKLNLNIVNKRIQNTKTSLENLLKEKTKKEEQVKTAKEELIQRVKKKVANKSLKDIQNEYEEFLIGFSNMGLGTLRNLEDYLKIVIDHVSANFSNTEIELKLKSLKTDTQQKIEEIRKKNKISNF